MKNIKNSKAIEELFIRNFPEFKDNVSNVISDEVINEMLQDYHRCEIVMNKFLELDKRKVEYLKIKEELKNEIREYVLGHFIEKK